jgi:predicted NAD-dependent protein-ADP-ribosyltransferase YbiA (DUF1768 family)
MAVLFYSPDQPYYEFSNFYQPKIPFVFNHIEWKNSEAYYQAQKWTSPDNCKETVIEYQKLISLCDTPNKAYIYWENQNLYTVIKINGPFVKMSNH